MLHTDTAPGLTLGESITLILGAVLVALCVLAALDAAPIDRDVIGAPGAAAPTAGAK